MPRYIPPHLRNKQASDANTSPTSPSTNAPEENLRTRSLEEQLQNTKISSSKPARVNYVRSDALSIYDIHTHYSGYTYATAAKSTLNDSLERPEQLSYIALFKDANPRWDSDGIIFAKTNIEFLPGHDEAFKGSPSGEDVKYGGFRNTTGGDEEQSTKSMNGDTNKTVETQVTETDKSGEHAGQAKESTIEHQKLSTDEAPVKDNPGNSEDGTLAASPPANQANPSSTTPTSPNSALVNTINNLSPHDVSMDATFPPIPVFTELHQKSNFHFSGYYRLTHLSFLYPFSAALVRMQQQKWDLKDKRGRKRPVQRDSAAWQSSLRVRWAVIGMEKVEGLQAPKIEKLDEEVRVKLRRDALREKYGDEFEEDETGHFRKKKAVGGEGREQGRMGDEGGGGVVEVRAGNEKKVSAES